MDVHAYGAPRALATVVPGELPQGKRGAIQTATLQWFAEHRRSVPWREEPSPYRVWVSEIMLQQTRTDTVLPYFRRWMRRFPTLGSLAGADLGEVLKMWEGLGYYSRARNLHATARFVSAQLGGELPDDPEALRRLPGIGRYTANAIASIAFGKDVPVVDGNVSRVLSRLFAIESDITAAATQERLWALATELLPRGKAATFNQALMEFGSRVCTPRRPACPRCTIRRWCAAYAAGSPEAYPRKKRRVVPRVAATLGVIWQGDRVLVQRRPPQGFLGGLWEFPGGKRRGGETLRACLRRELQEEVGYRGAIGPKVMTIEHGYSMFHVTLHAYECVLEGSVLRPKAAEWRWATLEDLRDLPFPAANRRLLETLERRRGGLPVLTRRGSSRGASGRASARGRRSRPLGSRPS